MDKLSGEVLRAHKGVSFVGVSTCFFCYRSDGKFFLAKRSKKARDEQGRWEMGGGGLKWGMAAIDNIKRELKEEYNALPKDVRFMGYRDVFRENKGQPTHWLCLDFAILVDPKNMRINEPDMFDDSGWFTLGTLPSPLHSQQQIFFDMHKKELEELGIR
ncbi:NUDIX domain-containing protein [Candidatus Saccharibacteria bacterium]|nr:NUDIX domain-containing protein [Candidatus Saccharibacteria bacterium]